MRIIILLLGFSVFFGPVYGQSFSTMSDRNPLVEKVQKSEPEQGRVVIKQDVRINRLLNLHLLQNQRAGWIPIYRIRIYSDLGHDAREEANRVKAHYMHLFEEEDVESHLIYQSPYYKVYVGDFYCRSEALKFKKKIESAFSTVFIVTDKYPIEELDLTIAEDDR